jgi:hypothetical protein
MGSSLFSPCCHNFYYVVRSVTAALEATDSDGGGNENDGVVSAELFHWKNKLQHQSQTWDIHLSHLPQTVSLLFCLANPVVFRVVCAMALDSVWRLRASPWTTNQLIVVGGGWQGQHNKDRLISRSEWHQNISKGISKGIGAITLLLAMLGQCNAKWELAAHSMVVSSIIFLTYGTGVWICVECVCVECAGLSIFYYGTVLACP